jgi:serine/threonine protein kinase
MPEQGTDPRVPTEAFSSVQNDSSSPLATRLDPTGGTADQLPPPEPNRVPALHLETERGSPPPTEQKCLPPVIPGYQILGELGHGGMGVVYQARQVSLDRVVALKMIRSGDLASPQDLARFRGEAEAVARLKHPNIVHIYEVGEREGRPYFSLEYVEGGNLAQKVKGVPQPPRGAAELVEVLARAVHAAHQRGIIHRDLKPANVLLTPDGVPKITDFGIAKRLDLVEAGQTRTGTIMGTPSYMAPEQAAGKTKEIGPAADVYSLGAILYELLTGRPPFLAETWEATRELVLTTEPVPPRRLQPKLPSDLQTICLKCLEKEPQRRYASAGALAEDLKRWQQGEPILARPETQTRRTWRFARRHPLSAMVMAVIVFALIIAPVVTYLTRPERRIEAIERELRQGHNVTLLGDTGQPRWYRWRTTEGSKKAFESDDGTFALQSFEHGLLELVRDPQQDSFLFCAEVRHDQGPRAESEAGIFFNYTNHATTEGLEHRYCVLAFSDSPDGTTYGGTRPDDVPPDGLPVGLKLLRHREPDMSCVNNPIQIDRIPFPPFSSRDPPPWHRVALRFTADNVRYFWDGDCKAEFSRKQLTEAAGMEEPGRSIHGDSPNQEEVISRFGPRNGLGLYIYRSTASFRNVLIEPF